MRITYGIPVVLALIGLAQAQDIDPKKQQERIEALEKKVTELQQRPDSKPKDVQAPPAEGKQSPVRDRQALNDQQEGAPRADGVALDPKYRGFFSIPNTPVIMKINAKPHLDVTFDTRNAGDDNRFVTGKIPVEGAPNDDAGVRSNINAKGSQLRIDVRAPGVAGNPRFYYQNDFYGSGGGEFPYRIQQFWGQIYNITVGHTYSVFEDPDAWPDTVDYEGPNAVLFARRALIRYEAPLSNSMSLNFGIEQPDTFPVDLGTAGNPDGTVAGINHVPDFTANIRCEDEGLGHVQFSGIYRYLAASSTVYGKDETSAWGLSLATGINVGKDTTITLMGVVGKGMATLGNDTSFFNTDAAFDPSGNLTPLPYYSLMAAISHKWSDEWRSTASYGFVNLDNGDTVLDAGVYGKTQYVSANLIWQLRKRLSIGAEVLYGTNEVQGGADGHVVRVQFGLVYSLFD
jgi:hypothetical protein